MGFFADLFSSPRPQFKYVVKNVLNETIAEFPVRDLAGSICLRGRDLSHASLRGQSLAGADLEGTIFVGADLRGCNFAKACLRNANMAYALVDGARFDRAELDGVDLLHTNIRLVQLDGANITPASTIPGIRVVWV